MKSRRLLSHRDMLPPLRIFRTENKPAVPGLIPTFRADTAADPIRHAADCSAFLSPLPPSHRALHILSPLGSEWATFADPVAALTARTWAPPSAIQWWKRFVADIPPLSLIICDEESWPTGTNIWQVTADILNNPAVRRAMPAVLRACSTDRILAKEPISYQLYVNWTAGKRAAAIRVAIPAQCEVANYGDGKYPLPDENGWPNMAVRTDGRTSMPVSYPGIRGNAVPDAWAGLRFAENALRAQNRAAGSIVRPFVSYAAFANNGPEQDAERQLRLWAWRQNFRSAVRQNDTLIYWEGPPIDPESDAIAAEEIARAQREVTRRWQGLPPIGPEHEHIVTGDYVICRREMPTAA